MPHKPSRDFESTCEAVARIAKTVVRYTDSLVASPAMKAAALRSAAVAIEEADRAVMFDAVLDIVRNMDAAKRAVNGEGAAP